MYSVKILSFIFHKPPMYKFNMAENPEKQTAWICRLDQYPHDDTKPKIIIFSWKR